MKKGRLLSPEAKPLEGKVLAAQIQEQIKKEIEAFALKGFKPPGLLVLQADSNPSSTWYVGQQEKLSAKLGIRFEKIGPEKITTQADLITQLESRSHSFHGIFLAQPFPKSFNADEILLRLDLKKDVEGVHPASLGLIVLRKTRLIPPTAYAALQLIEHAVKESGKNLKGMKAAIVGQSAIVGRPLNLLLGEKRVTTIVCNTGTSAADLQKFVSESDIVVACAGQPGLVKGSWIKPGAIVIDVGTTEVNGKLMGDVEFEEAKKHASYITPVPGGVGPLTVTMLMQNLLHAYQWQHNLAGHPPA